MSEKCGSVNNRMCPKLPPSSCNCYASKQTYGTGYGSGSWPVSQNSQVASLFESFTPRCEATESCGCYSNRKNYGMAFGMNYERNWRCSTPNGCVRQRTQASEGVI